MSRAGPHFRRWLGLSGLTLAVGFQWGCNGSGPGAKSADAELTRRDTTIVHEACDIKSSNADKLDPNGDGQPDVYIVRSGSRELCRAVDLNFDGIIDVYSYRDDSGRLRRRETDYDRDGRIDEISIFQAGVMTEQHRATTLANRLDTWQFFQGGKLARTERDADGDAVVDQWWEYPTPGCPLIHSDVDGDGRPDPGATIDYCKETGYVPPERHGPREHTSPTFERPGALPTEVENKEMGEGGKSPPSPQGAGSGGTTPGGGGKP
jgi:hypothetical protein